MFCAAYERKLKDAAAAGGPLSVELRQHVRVCGVCAAEWEREQALLVAIDGNVREAVKVETPASLIAGVRERIAELGLGTSWWKPALTLSATLVMVGIGARLIFLNWKPRVVPEQDRPVAIAAPIAQHGSTEAMSGTDETQGAIASAEQLREQHGIRVRLASREGEDSHPMGAEVLAAPIEMAGLQQYMQRLRAKAKQGATLEQAKNEEPFAIRDVEFAEIDLGVVTIAPLDGAK